MKRVAAVRLALCVALVAPLLFASCAQTLDVGSRGTAGATGGAGGSGESSSSGAGGSGGMEPSCDGGLVACGGNCIQVTDDGHNCGACGRDCLGDACSSGKCPTSTVLDFEFAERLVADDGSLFWSSSHCVSRANKDGSARSDLYCDDLWNGAKFPGHLAMDKARLYWGFQDSKGGRVFAIDKVSGGGAPLLELGPVSPYGVAVDEGSRTLFYASRGTGQKPMILGSSSLDAPMAGTLGSVPVIFLGGVAFSTTDVFAVSRDAGWLVKVPRAGGQAAPFAQGFVAPEELAIDATDVYVADTGADNVMGGAIVKVALADGKKTVLVDHLNQPAGIALDGPNVYFTTRGDPNTATNDGQVFRVAKKGGPPVVLADTQFDPRDVVVDDKYAYWNNRGLLGTGQSIRRVPK